jgi:DNA-binding response OmpR family regulator
MARILVVEDRSTLRSLYQIVLSRLEHEVTLAPTGEAGVEAAARLRPDLVIMDLMLPGISGAEAAQELRDAGILPTAPLIITTATSTGEAKAVAAALGACAVLLKPFEIDALLEAVQEALSSSTR